MSETVKILLLEDNKADIELIKTEFLRAKFNYELEVVKDKESFQKRLKEFSPNIILSDYNLPQFDGLSALKIAVVEDITERKKAEEAVKESEEKFRSVVENSHEGIFIVDNVYKFSYVNDEFCKMSGYSRRDLIGFDFRKFLEKKSKTMIEKRYKKRQLGEKVPNR
jgi:PAS domain-containing protein